MLLFGGSKLPQLAKALGQSKRAFKEGLDEAEEEDLKRDKLKPTITAGQPAPPALSAIDDEALFEEARRRAANLRATNNTAQIEGDKNTSGQMR